jgi:SAM-dependent methyltransferase
MIKIVKKIIAKFIFVFSCLRAKLFPNFFIKTEQYWNERGIEGMHQHNGYNAFSSILRSYIPSGVRVLDLGCNKGLETAIIAKTNDVFGVDVYKTFVAMAQKRGIRAKVMDFHNLKFFEEFDCVYSNNSLEHAKFPEKVISGVWRALKSNGIFIIGMPLDGNNPLARDPAHFFRAKKEDILRLLESANFNVVENEVIDTKERWGWEIPPSLNKMLIVVAKKL